jgi:hypothetical protein
MADQASARGSGMTDLEISIESIVSAPGQQRFFREKTSVR